MGDLRFFFDGLWVGAYEVGIAGAFSFQITLGEWMCMDGRMGLDSNFCTLSFFFFFTIRDETLGEARQCLFFF